jgi:hypothetical protein
MKKPATEVAGSLPCQAASSVGWALAPTITDRTTRGSKLCTHATAMFKGGCEAPTLHAKVQVSAALISTRPRSGRTRQLVIDVLAARRAAGVPHGDVFAALAFDVVADDARAQQAAAGAAAGAGDHVAGVVEHV